MCPVSLLQMRLLELHRLVLLSGRTCMLDPALLPVWLYKWVIGQQKQLKRCSFDVTAATENSGNQITYPIVTQPNTPSKLIGTSPRPSILRKRDYEG